MLDFTAPMLLKVLQRLNLCFFYSSAYKMQKNYANYNMWCNVQLIGWKEKEKTLLVDPEEIDCLKNVGRLNENADSIYELYRNPNPACEAGSIWKDIVLSPSRFNIQQELKYSIQKVERFKQYLQETPRLRDEDR